MERVITIGTRCSRLALSQIGEIIQTMTKRYPEIKVEVVSFKTSGDRDKATPLADVERTDFFTDEIDRALLEGRIDCAIHSAKDLPAPLTNGLAVAALTASIDPDEILVSRAGLLLDGLPRGATIGTSSLRRKTQLKMFRPDLNSVDIRGNIEERLELLDARG